MKEPQFVVKLTSHVLPGSSDARRLSEVLLALRSGRVDRLARAAARARARLRLGLSAVVVRAAAAGEQDERQRAEDGEQRER